MTGMGPQTPNPLEAMFGTQEMIEPAFPQHNQGASDLNPAFQQQMQENLAAEYAEKQKEISFPQPDLLSEIFKGDWSVTATVVNFTLGMIEGADPNNPLPEASAIVQFYCIIEYDAPTDQGGTTPALHAVPISDEVKIGIPYLYLAKFKRPDKVSIADVEVIIQKLFSNCKITSEPPRTLEKLLKPAEPFSGDYRRD